MGHGSGLNDLPNELLLLIGDEIGDDLPTLKALVQLCKRCYDLFSLFLYQKVSDIAFPTLALSEKSRLPLTGAHPASYVSKVLISPEDRSSAAALQMQVAHVMKNIALQSKNGGLQSFTFRSTSVSLPEVLGSAAIPALDHLKELFLHCPFPIKDELSWPLAGSLLESSLTVLELTSNFSMNCSPHLPTLAKLVKMLPISCPGLKRLSFDFQGHRLLQPAALANLMKDDSFFLPCLTEFSFKLDDWDENFFNASISFLHRHPAIEVLKYLVLMSREVTLALPSTGLTTLPQLRYFEGAPEDAILLCEVGTRPIKHLTLAYTVQHYPELQDRLHDAFAKTASIRELTLRAVSGYDMETLRRILPACPNLTHLECVLNYNSSERRNIALVYQMLMDILPHLMILNLHVQTWTQMGRALEGKLSGMLKEDWMKLLATEHKAAIAAAIYSMRSTERSNNLLSIQVRDVETYGTVSTPLLDYTYKW